MKTLRPLLTVFIIYGICLVAYGQTGEMTEDKLVDKWELSGCDTIEGIYVQQSPPYLKLGVIKNDSIYKLVYFTTLVPSINYRAWEEGDLKAVLTPSEEQGIFHCTWYDVNHKPISKYYFQVEGAYLDLISYRSIKKAKFNKVYPVKQED